jgi:hypothetical protein
MATLYRNKAGDYQILDGDEYTEDFKLLCWKLNDLTPEQFAQGVEMMEYQEQEGRKTGDETWPPSYAGFIGLATMRIGPPKGTYQKRIASTMPLDDKKAATSSIMAMLDE